MARRRLAVLVLAVVLFGAACGGGDDESPNDAISDTDGPTGPVIPTTAGSSSAAPGRQIKTPWTAPRSGVAALIGKAGLPALPKEMLEYHLHAHLDLFIDGAPQDVPANLGIDLERQVISPLHTHDESGVIHVENDKPTDFFLGQLFVEWDIRLDRDCVGAYCRASTPWDVYVDGVKDTGDPARVQFARHRQIAIVIGKAPPTIPSTYAFPQGL